MLDNSLRYSIRDEFLYGTVAGGNFSMKAFSGGGRGSTAGKEQTDLKHWSTSKQAPQGFDEHNRGGPLPVGMYLATYFGRHPHLGFCARLDQTISSLIQTDYNSSIGFSVTKRHSFYIHGRGSKGSDGCIVPASRIDLQKLLAAIKKAGRPVMVTVHGEGMNADRLEASRSVRNIA